MRVLHLVVDEDIAALRVVALVDRHYGQDLRAGEMPGRPADFLRRGPGAARQPGQDDRDEVADRGEQLLRIGHQRKRAIEIGMARERAGGGERRGGKEWVGTGGVWG